MANKKRKEIDLLINYLFKQAEDANLCSAGKERLRWIMVNGHRFTSIMQMVQTWSVAEQKEFFRYFSVDPQASATTLKDQIAAQRSYIKGYHSNIKSYQRSLKTSAATIKKLTAELKKAKDRPLFSADQFEFVVSTVTDGK